MAIVVRNWHLFYRGALRKYGIIKDPEYGWIVTYMRIASEGVIADARA